MTQNRNKLLDLFEGNVANAVLHIILDKCNNDENIAKKYVEEWKISLEVARRYRRKINPAHTIFQKSEGEELKRSIISRVRAEVLFRISKGYTIDSSLIDVSADDVLRELNVL